MTDRKRKWRPKYEPNPALRLSADRISGGICPACGFNLLPSGKCGVCANIQRIGRECVAYLEQEPTLAAIAIWEDE